MTSINLAKSIHATRHAAGGPDVVTPAAIGAATPAEVAAAVAALVNSAPGTLDTLGELATALQSGDSVAAALAATVADKATIAALNAEIALARNASSLSSGTVADARLPVAAQAATLSSTFVGLLAAPKVDAPLLIATPVTITKTGTNASASQNSATGKFYGSSTANGHYMTSMDLVTWADQTYSPSTYTPSLMGLEFDLAYMYAYSTLGRIWRAPLDVFNDWTEITVPGKGPLTTGRPGSLCALGSGVLIYGNYTSGGGDGAHLWRSTDAGATWTEVLTLAAAKHVHAVRLNPATGVIWATVGDAGWPGLGLYKSINAGLTWTLMSSNDYGIDIVFVPATARRGALVAMEGDGINRPLLMAYPQDGAPGDKSYPLAWFTGAPGDAASTRGTTRGIRLTANGDIIFWTTTEGGTVGTKAGLYIAQGPDFTRVILLADTTGAEPAAYMRTHAAGAISQNYLWTFPTPTFGSY